MIMVGLAMVILAGCQKQDVMTDTPSPQPSPEAPATYVLADLALSLPSPSAAGTRLDESVVQAEGQFRGIQKLTIVPFSKQGRIGLDDQPSYAEIDHLVVNNFATEKNEKLRYYSKVYLKHGVASFLTYGQATLPVSYQKKEYGSLVLKLEGTKVTEVPEKMTVTPANLNFELEPIYDDRDGENHVETPTEATAIADYMTSIAQAQADETNTWANSDDEKLKPLYENFVAKNGESFDVLAGSAANVKAYVAQLKAKLESYVFDEGSSELDIKTDIISRIDDPTMSAACEVNYPGNRNLPDGAAVLQWCAKDGTYGFVPQTQTTTIAPISGIYRYAYPPELYYFGNSQIKTSNTEVTTADYTGKSSWADIVNTSYTFGNAVTPNTRAVAIKDPLQYGVAQLQATVKAMTSSMDDAKTPVANKVTVGDDTFPITGIIVSGQFPVNFDFTPQYDGASDDNEHFVYDSQLGNHHLTTTATAPFRTLLLQTHDGEKVKVILELVNNSDTDFTGENNGIVYRGTKFYLLGEVTPPQGKPVFKQDEITTMEMKVKTLKHAYNVMPNIQSGRLEVSVEINLKWTQATPQTIEFEE